MARDNDDAAKAKAGGPKTAEPGSHESAGGSENSADAIEYLPGAGVVKGNTDDTFRPDDATTREEMIKMVDTLFELPELGEEGEFMDAPDTPEWVSEYVDVTIPGPVAEAAALKADLVNLRKDEVDDTISGPAAEAVPLKAGLANLRKDEDEAKSDIEQDDVSRIDTDAIDDTLGQALDASTKQGGAPENAELAAPFVPGGAVLSAADAPDEDDPKANDIEDA